MTSDLPGLELREALADLIELHVLTVDRAQHVYLRGRLLLPSEQAYDLAASRLRLLGYTAQLRREKQEDVIVAVPGLYPPTHERIWINGLLYFLTILTTLYVGAGWAGVDPFKNIWQGIVAGAPFAGTLLLILTAHELGHYFVGRHYGMQRTLPYFIPMINFFGTMGAVIALRTPPKNRRALLAMAVAGPLAGLALAIPLYFVGLRLSTLGPQGVEGSLMFGDSLLGAALQVLALGRHYPSGGLDVYIHPVALAAWVGMFVTALNLIPAGQLDGGHAAYCLIGERARYLTWVVAGALALLAWLGSSPEWWLWVVLLLVFGRTFATPLDDVTPLSRRGKALAIAMMVILVLVFVPIPIRYL